ncbi:unnamed protein product [Caenorhabditis bovis]|uniref:DUF38 domain-containing protein n=1 Tax=Caenorhabditis bovis TaxID=2654633 RepID=A0A8S1FAH1_9PELO|nr:unnamed protein product [Caenorhabditis bovis]
MHISPVLFLIFLVQSGATQYYFGKLQNYGCRCLQKDKAQEILNPYSKQPFENLEMRAREPTLTSNLQHKIHMLKEWLANLSLHPLRETPTPTPPPTTIDPLALPYEDGITTINSTVMRIIQKMLSKYFKKWRSEWSILDRFECVCQGDLVELLKAKTFINIQIAHD